MQAEISLEDKSLQTSPRKDFQIEEQKVLAIDFVPKVANDLVSSIVANLPIKIDTNTQETTTEPIKTVEQVSQTTPRNESEDVSSEPYEIHIQTSFVVQEDANISIDTPQHQSKPFVMEIQKTFVIDDTQPNLVRELESTSHEKAKKTKSKKKKSKSKKNESEKVEQPIDTAAIEEKSKEDSTSSTFATLKITKTTVYETSNLISKERRPHGPSSVIIEEVHAGDSLDIPISPGNGKTL